ncbi:MAG: UTP--glucose-1-phosphate uridylyltransferase GalU [Proteobacteria bacterium]|nr:MAG: UTP--glucose-1-phosphate uridylyltransferase GalU [Pseudomonadota bacterium]
MQKITKAIFPVAGMGTRFLPATKASPKEMLPIVDKPLIQYAVEEAVDAGITDLIFITGRNKRTIEDHFDKAYELETELELRNKAKLLDIVQNILPSHVRCVYIRQAEALGLGHAVLMAEHVINDEPFAVILADELMDCTPNALSQMIKIYEQTSSSVLGVNEVRREDVCSYGIIKPTIKAHKFMKIDAIVEKPLVDDAPSNLAVVGRYILTPRIMKLLSATDKGAGGEIQLTDAISDLLDYESIFAHKIIGNRYDCGSKLGYLQATVSFGLKHQEIGNDLTNIIKSLELD